MLNIRFSTINLITIYLIVAYVIWLYKPTVFFKDDGGLKSFGLRENETIFYYPLTMIFLSIILFYLFELKN